MKPNILPIAALSCIVLAQPTAIAAPQQSSIENTTSEVVVDYSGKPPFKRRIQSVNTVDLAQFETTTSPCETKRTAIFAGKPPFKRVSECATVVDVAQFEVTTEQAGADFSGRPPFKRH